MKLYNQSFEFIYQSDGFDGMIQHIERAARICYKSEDRITEGSAQKFVDNMIKSKHTSTLEHGTVYLKLPKLYVDKPESAMYTLDFLHNKYSVVKFYNDDPYNYVTTNYRVIIEKHLEKALQYQCDYIYGKHERRITIKFITNLQVSHELVRHRTMSFSQESSRYCNYTKGKFGGELGFIKPLWLDEENLNKVIEGKKEGICAYSDLRESYWYIAMEQMEHCYLNDIEAFNAKPQEAAQFLPKATKTEIVVTGTVSQWKTLLDMRALGSTGAPHPQMKELMLPLYITMRNLNILDKSEYEKEDVTKLVTKD